MKKISKIRMVTKIITYTLSFSKSEAGKSLFSSYLRWNVEQGRMWSVTQCKRYISKHHKIAYLMQIKQISSQDLNFLEYIINTKMAGR